MELELLISWFWFVVHHINLLTVGTHFKWLARTTYICYLLRWSSLSYGAFTYSDTGNFRRRGCISYNCVSFNQYRCEYNPVSLLLPDSVGGIVGVEWLDRKMEHDESSPIRTATSHFLLSGSTSTLNSLLYGSPCF